MNRGGPVGFMMQIQKPEECRRSMLSFLAGKGVV